MRKETDLKFLSSKNKTILEFLTLAKSINDNRYSRSGERPGLEFFTSKDAFYINYCNFHGTFAVGSKTHDEQFIFPTNLQAQKQGCKEFLEWYKKK